MDTHEHEEPQEPQRLTLEQFIKSAGISMTAERTDRNPNMDDSANMDHWRVVLKAGRSRLTTYFSMGYGYHGKAPKASEVLSCLASDASSADESFEDWCANYDFDTDSRKAERTYRAVQSSTAKLRKFLGESVFDTLLYHTEQE